MNIYKIPISVLVVTGLLFQAAGSTRAADVPEQRQYCYFLAGMTMLDNDHSDNDTVKAQKYKQLCALTGVSASTARVFIDQYKNKPDEWQKVQTVIADILDKQK